MPLGTPDAAVIETSSGDVFVVADPAVTDEHLHAITLAAEYLPHQRGDDEPAAPLPRYRAG